MEYFGADALPEGHPGFFFQRWVWILMYCLDFGGSLPASGTLQDPFFEQLLSVHRSSHPSSSSEESLPQLQTPESGLPNSRPRARLPLRLDTSVPTARSPFNPFFGYPVSPTSLNPRHGRRRKRDLLKTLAYLWWVRWRRTATWIVVLVVTFLLSRWRLRLWLNRRRQMISQRAH